MLISIFPQWLGFRLGLDFYAVGGGEGCVGDVAGIQDACWFEAEDFGFFIGAGSVFDAAWDYDAFAGIECDDVVSEFDAEASLEDEEEFVFVFMMVPGEFALHFDEFDLLIVQPCDHFWPPVFAEEAEFFGKIDWGGHRERSGERIFFRVTGAYSRDGTRSRIGLRWLEHA
jgi:hypothetical protein